ncbi:MAG: hypothetical protein ACTSPY_15180 [Candidatus Helarchaeota archaeon]
MASDDLKIFMKETFEFYSKIRASERERFETTQQFMVQSMELLKEISEDFKKIALNLESKLDEIKTTLDDGIEAIKSTLGIDHLKKSNIILQDILDKLQRHSYLMEYKEIIKDLKKFVADFIEYPGEIGKEKVVKQGGMSVSHQVKKGILHDDSLYGNVKRPTSKFVSPIPRNGQRNVQKVEKFQNNNNLDDVPTFMKLEKEKQNQPINEDISIKTKPIQPRHPVKLKHVSYKDDENEN